MQHTAQYFSILFFICYMVAGFIYPSIRTYSRTGINPFVFSATDNAHDYIGRAFKVLIAVIAFSIILFSVGGSVYTYSAPMTYLQCRPLQVLGMLLCLLSLAWTMVAQWQMGNSWRIGIDEQNKTAFVTTGLFSVSRNPIFLGMLVTIAGLFLLMPNAITFCTLLSGYLLIQVQVRLEEEFLSRQYGESYSTYKQHVARFLSIN